MTHVRFRKEGGVRALVLVFLLIGLLLGWQVAGADTMPTIYRSFAGNVNFVGTQKTLRTGPNTSNSSAAGVTSGATTATLSGIPPTATILAAYLYWAGSSDTPDYTVTFQGTSVSADPARRYTATFTSGGTDFDYFSGVADVTALVTGNGNYTFSGLTVENGDPWYSSQAVLAGWALLVVYSDTSEAFRVLNVYEGFQAFRDSSITLSLSNFKIPSSPISGRVSHITWEGDVGNSDPGSNYSERLSFNGNTLTDSNNPANNQFNSVSTIRSGAVDNASYGIDFDAYDVSAYLVAGQTSATTVYSSGDDLVLLSAEVITVTNVPVADLELGMVRGGALVGGQNATYTLTVKNNGPLVEAGPVTVVDSLPSGLTFVSGTGTGWSCSLSGQTVTCTRSGSIASGASAPSLVLTVAVAAGASGTVTNTATVTGTSFDNFTSNNTVSDSYDLPLLPYAWYAMDEAAWDGTAGQVADSGAVPAQNGTAVGGVSTIPTPAGGVKGDTCRGADIPRDTSAGIDHAVNTGIGINSLGNAGTIAFWYKSRRDWNVSTSNDDDRTLLDGTGGSAAREFWLVLRQNGSLRFRLDNDTWWWFPDQTVTTPTFNTPANTWVHIAITWSFNPSGSRFMRIYVNGSLAAERVSTSVYANSSYGNLYIGDASGATSDANRGNSADGAIDEVRVYNAALSAGQIQVAMGLFHSCSGGVHHYELSLPTSGISCLSTPVTVTACANADSPCARATGVAGTSASLSADHGTLTPASVIFDAAGLASANLAYPGASDGVAVNVSLSGEQVGAGNPRQCCPDGATCLVRDYCSTTFNTAGFIFSGAANGAAATMPPQVAGTSSATYYLRAVKTNTATKACEAGLKGKRQVGFAYECNDPASCYGADLMSVNGGTSTLIKRNDSGSVSSYQTVDMTFDDTGNAPFTFNYVDVGKVRLHASTTVGGATLVGSTNSFTVKPFDFLVVPCTGTAPCISPPADPGTAGAGSAFAKAGSPFKATITARAAGGTATPSFGRGTGNDTEAVNLAYSLVAPTGQCGGTDCPATLGGTTSMLRKAFSDGVASVTNLTWSEVGVIKLTATNSTFLGGSLTTTGSTGNVGRFYPHHFDVVVTPQCGGFVYSGRPGTSAVPGQPFTVKATAMNGLTPPAPTANYDKDGGFARDVDLTLSIGGAGIGKLYVDSTMGGSRAIPKAKFEGGVGQVNHNDASGKVSYVFDSFPTAVTAVAVHADDVDTATSMGTDGTTTVRAGRLWLGNAYGNELLPLPVPAQTQYWTGSYWRTSQSDTCTSLTVPTAGNGGLTNALQHKTTAVTPLLVSNGKANLTLTTPGAGNAGVVDITGSVLQQGNGWLDLPVAIARACFGRCGPRSPVIYLRERY